MTTDYDMEERTERGELYDRVEMLKEMIERDAATYNALYVALSTQRMETDRMVNTQRIIDSLYERIKECYQELAIIEEELQLKNRVDILDLLLQS